MIFDHPALPESKEKWDEKLTAEKKRAVKEAHACWMEKGLRENQKGYRNLAHEEFLKLQADVKVDSASVSGECRHCMEEWEHTSTERLVMMTCCKAVIHKNCAVEALEGKPHECCWCMQRLESAVPFGIKMGATGIKLEPGAEEDAPESTMAEQGNDVEEEGLCPIYVTKFKWKNQLFMCLNSSGRLS